MAAVSVFVDEAVRGRLPMVCARTGRPADMVVRTTRSVGGGISGAAWLLVFLGPPGWGVLFLLAVLGSGGEELTVRIPRTRADFESERQLRRWMWTALVTGAASLLCAVFLATHGLPLLWLGLGIWFLVVGAALYTKVFANDIGVALDASRRWVTFTGVHPDFARAVEEQEAELHRA